MQLVVLGRAPLAEVLTTLPTSGAWLDGRAMGDTWRVGDWSVGDWGLLATRGARGVILALEDTHAKSHDHVHGEGAHDRTMSTLRAARTVRLPVIIATSITRSNARSTTSLAAELVHAQVVAWHVALAVPSDAAESARVSPSLGVVMPHVLRSVDAASRSGIDVVLEGFPRCVLGPFARAQLRDTLTAMGAPCDACTARDGCPGLTSLHRQRFGASELRALATATPPDGPAPDPGSVRQVLVALSTKEDLSFRPAKTSAD